MQRNTTSKSTTGFVTTNTSIFVTISPARSSISSPLTTDRTTTQKTSSTTPTTRSVSRSTGSSTASPLSTANSTTTLNTTANKAPTSTTKTTKTMATTAPPQANPVVVFSIINDFQPEYTNSTSEKFRNLVLTVTAVLDVIYRTKYGTIFIRTIVLAFTPISRSRAANNGTQAQVELVFNYTTPDAIPKIVEIRDVLKAAVLNASSGSALGNLSVDAYSIIVMAFNTSTNLTANVITTTLIPSTTMATTTTTTTAVALTKVTVVFRSLQIPYTPDLSNPSNQAFKNRALLIKSELEPLYQSAFVSFYSLTVTKFSSGSIINTMNLAFKSSVPTNTAIANVLIKAASHVTGFDIDTASVTVNDIVNSGVSNKASLFTASCLVVLSLLLSRQQ
ncbi:hypothetical protein UPYG_G00243150 [Umbra pygmaea]|uniref:SEA domain-containing protein n=1 Tax=Umbra pygmaea TaxID=75934 RepID=A0ABD0WKS7_UMBPY